MYKYKRCYESPMNYSKETSYKHHEEIVPNEYPEAMPQNKMYSSMGGYPMMGCQVPPIYECPQERVCHREFVHEVPHIMPINTRIINHHVYRHTYTPCYTYCEENEVCNVYDGCCNNF